MYTAMTGFNRRLELVNAGTVPYSSIKAVN
jgi:hypothetical protein